MTPTTDYELRRALNFTDADLEANCKGRITERQRRSNYIYRRPEIIRSGAIGGLFLALGLFCGLLKGNSVFSLFGLLAIPSLVSAFAQWRQMKLDLQGGRVHSASGPVRLNVRPAGRHWVNYYVRVKTLEFQVDKRTFLAFRQGQRYVIYYTPRAKLILSAKSPTW